MKIKGPMDGQRTKADFHPADYLVCEEKNGNVKNPQYAALQKMSKNFTYFSLQGRGEENTRPENMAWWHVDCLKRRQSRPRLVKSFRLLP